MLSVYKSFVRGTIQTRQGIHILNKLKFGIKDLQNFYHELKLTFVITLYI